MLTDFQVITTALFYDLNYTPVKFHVCIKRNVCQGREVSAGVTLSSLAWTKPIFKCILHFDLNCTTVKF